MVTECNPTEIVSTEIVSTDMEDLADKFKSITLREVDNATVKSIEETITDAVDTVKDVVETVVETVESVDTVVDVVVDTVKDLKDGKNLQDVLEDVHEAIKEIPMTDIPTLAQRLRSLFHKLTKCWRPILTSHETVKVGQ